MARRTYSEEFRIKAVKQVTKNSYSINDTAERLGIHPDSLRNRIKRLESSQAIKKYQIMDANSSSKCNT